MRFEGVTPYDWTLPTHEVASKVVGQRNNLMKTDVLKVDIESVREGKQGIIASLTESKSCEDSIRADQNKGEHKEAPYSLPTGKIGVYEKEMVAYTEKTVTDGTCHAIKDICIDEGVHSLETVSNGNYGMIKEMTDDTGAMADDTCSDSYSLKSSSVNEHVDDHDTEQRTTENLLTGGGKLNDVTPSVETSSEKELLPLQVFDTDPWHADLSGFDCVNDQDDVTPSVKTISEKELLPLQVFDTDPWHADLSGFDRVNDQDQSVDHQEIGQGSMEEQNSTATAVPSTSKEFNRSNGEVESGVITFKFESRAAAVSGREESKENTDNQQSGEARHVLKSEEATQDGATASARSSFVQHGFGDSSLLGPSFLSGPIASSGHIPYSGSISHRSDSSTTSARSFAFPILQSEWNSSPVKMAKADRRRFRKHQGWRMGLLCCRF